SCRWVFRAKHDEDGKVERYKARFVAKGCSQKYGVDYTETFAPVVRFESVRALLSVGVQLGMKFHQMDVETAFLNGHLDEDIYMKQPEGFEEKGKENYVCHLKQSLYGLKQSPRMWNEVLDKQLVTMNFVKSEADSCIYSAVIEGEFILVAVFVDDIILGCRDEGILKKVKQQFSERFAVKDMGRLHYFLGIRIQQMENRSIWIGQDKYAENKLREFGFSDTKMSSTPMEVNTKIYIGNENSKIFDQQKYQSAIGSLLYLASATRPDLAFAVSKLAQFNSSPTTDHWGMIRKVFSYLRKTKNLGLLYSPSSPHNLIGYSDSDFAGDVNDRRSTSGFVFIRSGAAVSWRSRKQQVVTLSTAEAEYVALSSAVQEVVWLREILGSINQPQKSPTVIMEDNKAAIKIATNPVFHGRTKHIETKYHFTRDQLANGSISIQYCPTKEMLADALTKPLPKYQFEFIQKKLGLSERP
ncbi:MAG: hypothetical protein GY799_10210, partial [Desulfobulbaceae bacterium]|nr:hypothetical protein [Desulfobulbaceae bacterium]